MDRDGGRLRLALPERVDDISTFVWAEGGCGGRTLPRFIARASALERESFCSNGGGPSNPDIDEALVLLDADVELLSSELVPSLKLDSLPLIRASEPTNLLRGVEKRSSLSSSEP